jgi:small ligand-binding sensory domain FIST
MSFAAALSEHPDAAVAVGEVAGRVLEQLGTGPDLALLFVTAAHEAATDDIVDVVTTVLEPHTLVGAVAASVVGTEREVEDRPGITLWAAQRAQHAPLVLDASLAGWPSDLGFDPRAIVLIGDPFTFSAESFFEFLQSRHPGVPVIGGMASAARAPGQTLLFVNGERRRSGAVGVALGPGIEVETVVSQGCRPIGSPWAVTDGDGNVVRELAGKPPLHRLVDLAQDALTEDEVALLNRGGLHVGLVIDERKADFGPGDFLVRNVLGGDRATGAIAIGDAVEIGMTMQFHLRDAAAADIELHQLLAGRRAESALLFTCNGRGQYTFGVADHDAAALGEEVGPIPVAGFFAAGEFGAVGGRNFLHGFTASIALLRAG